MHLVDFAIGGAAGAVQAAWSIDMHLRGLKRARITFGGFDGT